MPENIKIYLYFVFFLPKETTLDMKFSINKLEPFPNDAFQFCFHLFFFFKCLIDERERRRIKQTHKQSFFFPISFKYSWKFIYISTWKQWKTKWLFDFISSNEQTKYSALLCAHLCLHKCCSRKYGNRSKQKWPLKKVLSLSVSPSLSFSLSPSLRKKDRQPTLLIVAIITAPDSFSSFQAAIWSNGQNINSSTTVLIERMLLQFIRIFPCFLFHGNIS